MSSQLSPAERQTIEELYSLFQPPRLRYCPLTPTPKQEAFLMLTAYEVFYGGAAGGGKTAALLMSALQYADVPGYHALLLRPSLAELALPGKPDRPLSRTACADESGLERRAKTVAIPRPNPQRRQRRDAHFRLPRRWQR